MLWAAHDQARSAKSRILAILFPPHIVVTNVKRDPCHMISCIGENSPPPPECFLPSVLFIVYFFVLLTVQNRILLLVNSNSTQLGDVTVLKLHDMIIMI